jgi:hypothetical protein
MIKWKVGGDYLILGMDTKEDVQNSDITALMSSLSMHKAILSQHHSLDVLPLNARGHPQSTSPQERSGYLQPQLPTPTN